MRSAVVNRYGSPDSIALLDVKPPVPLAGELLVRVKAAAINPIDWKLMCGSFRLFAKIKFPYTPGADVAGVVETTGDGVTNFKKGDEVFAYIDARVGGAMADYVIVPTELAAHKPRHLNFHEAASLPLAGVTVVQALAKRGAPIKSNDHYFVTGATGGVGSIAVQIIKGYGAYVSALVSEAGIPIVEQFGVDQIINYEKNDVRKIESRFDFIFDAAGKFHYLKMSHLLKKKGGIYVSTLPSFADFVSMGMFAPIRLVGYKKRNAFVLAKPYAPDLEYIGRQVLAHKLRAVIDQVYPLERITEAYRHSMSGHAKGKIVISMDD